MYDCSHFVQQLSLMKKYQHQKDINGCGIACIANLLSLSYGEVKTDFENRFYKIDRGVNIADMVRYLDTKGLKYKSKFFKRGNNLQSGKVLSGAELERDKYSKILGSITLIIKSEKYPIGHYLLRIRDGWIDPWIDLPSIDRVRAGVRDRLPDDPWYVLYPIEGVV